MELLLICFHTDGAIRDGFVQLCNYLAKSNNVFILTNEEFPCDVFSKGKIYKFTFDKSNITTFFSYRAYKNLANVIKNINYDCAFIYYFHPINLFLLTQIDHLRLIVYVHDHIVHLGVPFLKRVLIKLQLHQIFKKAKAIVVSSNFMRHDIIKKKMCKDESKIYVNYLGLLENHLYPQRVVEDIDVLFFGRIEYYKGLDVLLNSYNYITNKSVRFTIVGRGDIMKTFHLDNIPLFVDVVNRYVSDEELALFIQRSKIVVLPYYEATGTQTVQTVFYYKKPVIATNVGCFPEYITNGEDGLIVPAGNSRELAYAISLLLGNESLRAQMGLNGANKLNTIFSNSTITENYTNIFQKIINKKTI
ncbi:glycosyltransferase family 4 protein [Phocaeicola plebeius]|uniref:glycosyltransferase family 4 protein n=1 Tax=Phocaeicola plebeius TaxID=310297 RepID=UPI0026F2CDD5|nr:glycosyltransferase family 4 protein [Phocaeicola plebeius]